MSSSASADPVYGLGLTPARRKIVFAFLMLSMFMATLDMQIVSTALPTIVAEFNAMERFGWVTSAYLLAQSAIMPVYGKLGDLFGRKYVIMTAVFIFTLGSLCCGLSGSMNQLIAARVLQGLGGGGIMVSIFAINSDLFEPRERATYQSFSSLVLMASGSIGPAIGGLLTAQFGWRSIFLLNLPVAVLALSGLYLLLPLVRPARRPKIDWPGALALALAIASVVLWADSAQLFGSMFSPRALVLPVVALAAAVVWTAIERRAPEPILPLSLFRDPAFPLLLIVALTSGGLALGMVTFHALFLQMTTGLSPAHAGLFFIAITTGIAGGSLTAGRVISRTGRYKPLLVTGLFVSVAALAIMSQFGADTPLALIGATFLVQGIAIGLGQQSPVIGVQHSAPHRDVGAATGAVTLMRMGGAALGISIYGAILSARLHGLPAEAGPGDAVTAATYADAFTAVYIGAAAVAAMGLVAALALRPAPIGARDLSQPSGRAPADR